MVLSLLNMYMYSKCICTVGIYILGRSIVDCFCRSAATIRGYERQDERNLLGSNPSNGENVAVGMGGPSVAIGMAWLAAESSLRALRIMEQYEDF